LIVYFIKWFIFYVFEKRCEITLFILNYQIFKQKFTIIPVFLSFCQLSIAFLSIF